MEPPVVTEKPLTDNNYLLQKFSGKGGWTFAAIPEISQDKHAWFGWVKVSGTIDGFEIKNYHLMPMGDGTLMLPVKSEIRKKIGKNDGDWVHVVLYSDQLPAVAPDDFMLCLQDEPNAYHNFMKLSKKEQEQMTNWIFSVKSDALRVERIAQAINALTDR